MFPQPPDWRGGKRRTEVYSIGLNDLRNGLATMLMDVTTHIVSVSSIIWRIIKGCGNGLF